MPPYDDEEDCQNTEELQVSDLDELGKASEEYQKLMGNQLGLIPRSFQLRIFNEARQKNVIAVLETGAGKTFIAAMLIKHMHIAEMARGGKVFSCSLPCRSV